MSQIAFSYSQKDEDVLSVAAFEGTEELLELLAYVGRIQEDADGEISAKLSRVTASIGLQCM